MEIAAAVEKMTAILPELARNGLAPAGSSSLGPWAGLIQSLSMGLSEASAWPSPAAP